MPVPTWGWTERHSAVAALIVVAVGTALVGLMEVEPVSLWIAGAAAVAAVVGLYFEAWTGALVGLAAAVGVVAVRRWTGHWSQEVFTTALLETVALIAVGAAAGHAGRALRRGGQVRAAHSPFDPVHGSLGLLGSHAALARLQEDVERGERLARPVSLALFEVVITDESLSPAGREAAERAVARVVESRAGEHDVPFALTSERLGIGFPDSGVAAVWDVVGRVLDSVATATITVGTERTPRALSDTAEVLVGIARQGADMTSAAALLADAVAALERARAEGMAT